MITSVSDLVQIYNSPHLDPDHGPKELQNKVMFDVHYYMCHRGNENILDMTKDTFNLCYNQDTKIAYVMKVEDEMTKNH